MSRLILAVLASVACGVSAFAQRAAQYDIAAAADNGLKTGVAIDIARHNGGVWLATGKGLQVTFDDGLTWLQYSSATGLVSDNVSALFSTGPRLWIATNHVDRIINRLTTISDGVSYTDNDGGAWTQINFGSGDLNIPYVWGGDRAIFDITGAHDTDTYRSVGVDWTFFTAFAGGFLASRDNGAHWRRIFPTPSDSIQFNTAGQAPSLRNRYFSCAADTSHGDSLFVWSGTAGGVFQYIYIQPREKLFSRAINRVAFCSSCGTGTKALIGGAGGVSIGKITGGPFMTRFMADGLPGNWISAITEIGGRVLVGTDSDSATSTGLAVSNNGGSTFAPVTVSPAVIGVGKTVSDFTVMRNRLYMAAQQAGMYVSTDTGATWTRLLIDSLTPIRATNIVNAFDVWGDTLRVGTDSGLVLIAMDSLGNFQSRTHFAFAESDSSSRRIIRVRTQQFLHDTTLVLDSTTIWTCNLPVTLSGRPMVGRSTKDSLGAVVFSHYQVLSTTYDVNFLGDSAFVVGSNGARYARYGDNPATAFSVADSVNPSTNLNSDTLTLMEVRGDTIIIGSKRGLAFSANRGKKFRIYRGNLDTLSADVVVNHMVANTLNTRFQRYGLTGDFVPAMAVRNGGGGPAEVWFSGRPVDAGFPGMAKTISVTDSTGTHRQMLAMNEDDFAWNIEFVDSSVYAATNAGLLHHRGIGPTDTLETWDTVLMVDNLTGDTLIKPGTPVYAVRRDSTGTGDFLWVGTDDGTVRIGLALGGNMKLFNPVDSASPKDQVYAFPVPFYPQQGDAVDFYFVVDQSGSVTVEVYDFAMNLVARPINNIYYAAGIYPNGSTQGRTWDGRNGRGDMVAVGVYYFKVILPGGVERWGKLAVLP